MNDEPCRSDIHTQVAEARRLFHECGLADSSTSDNATVVREMLRTTSRALETLEVILCEGPADWTIYGYIGECWAMLADGRQALDSNCDMVRSFRARSIDFLTFATERQREATGRSRQNVSPNGNVHVAASSRLYGQNSRTPDIESILDAQASKFGRSQRFDDAISNSHSSPAVAAASPSSALAPEALRYGTSPVAHEDRVSPVSSSRLTEETRRDLALVALSLQRRDGKPRYAPLGSLTEIYRTLDRVRSNFARLRYRLGGEATLPQPSDSSRDTPIVSQAANRRDARETNPASSPHRTATPLDQSADATGSHSFTDLAARSVGDLRTAITPVDSLKSTTGGLTGVLRDTTGVPAIPITGVANVEAYRHKGNALLRSGAHADSAHTFEIGARFAESAGLEAEVRAMMWGLASQAHECAWYAARQAGDTRRFAHHLVRDASCFEMAAAADFATVYVYRAAGKWFRTSKALYSAGFSDAGQLAEERSRAIICWGALPCDPPPAPPAL